MLISLPIFITIVKLQIDFYLCISYKPIQNSCVLAYKLVIYI